MPKHETIKSAYDSGQVAGWNAANGQGPADKPEPGRTKRSQAYYAGWERGYAEARQLQRNQRRAIMATRNPWS